MASHVFHEIYLHFNWHVKFDAAILIAEKEMLVHRFLVDRFAKHTGVTLHCVGGTETHVHAAVSIEPKVTISELVRDVKGGSAHDVNHQLNRRYLEWQRGYGVVSFSKRHLDWVVEYVRNQKEHHANQRLHQILELCGNDEEE